MSDNTNLLSHLDCDMLKEISARSPEWRIFLAEIVHILLNSYTPAGIPLWFNRRRSMIENRTPAEIIRNAQDISDAMIVKDMALALEPNTNRTMSSKFIEQWIEFCETLPEHE